MQLIEKILRDAVVSEADLARQLVVSPEMLRAYRAGTAAIPGDRQLCLALVCMELPPKSARLGAQLRNQVRATAAFEQGATKAHSGGHVSFRRV